MTRNKRENYCLVVSEWRRVSRVASGKKKVRWRDRAWQHSIKRTANTPQRGTGVMKGTLPRKASVIHQKKKSCAAALLLRFKEERNWQWFKAKGLRRNIKLACFLTHPTQTHVVAALLQIQRLQQLLHSLGKDVQQHQCLHVWMQKD